MSDVTDGSLIILGTKARGRPRLSPDGPGVPVTTWVPGDVHRELMRRAAQRTDQSVSGVVRDVLRKATGR